MDGLTIFGLVAVTAMLVCYALEHQNRWFILAFADADACGCGSVYGFLRGAGPFGLVEAIWAGGAAAMGESGPETLTPPGPRSCEEPRTFRHRIATLRMSKVFAGKRHERRSGLSQN